MDQKCKVIISIFTDSQVPFLTAKDIANKLNVSIRSIMRYINIINSIDDNESFRIVSIKNKGYHMQILDEEKFKEFYQGMNDYQSFSNEQLQLLMYTIVCAISSNELENQLGYSSSTIYRMVNSLNSKLEPRGIRVLKEHDQYKIIGNEIKIRNICKYIIDSNDSLFEILPSWIQKTYNDNCEFFKGINIENKDIQDYLFISIVRTQNGNGINFNQIIENIYKPYVNDALEVKLIEKYVTEHNNFKLSIGEEIFMALLLHYNSEDSTDNINALNMILPLIKKALTTIDLKYATNFSDDKNLINAISYHVVSSLDDYLLLKKENNDLLEQIRLNYTNEHCYALDLANELYEMLGITISDDDIGYITLHFANSKEKHSDITKIPYIIKYSSSYMTARLLEARLSARFVELSSIGIYQENEDRNKSDADIIFVFEDSMDNHSNERVMKVNPFINTQDEERIKMKINEVSGLKPFLLLCKNDDFYSIDKAKGKYELLDWILGKLMDKNQITKEECQNIIQREHLSSTEIANNVAFPHGVISGESFIAITVVRKPVLWHNSNVQLVITMGLNKDNDKNTAAIKYLFNNLANKELVERLINAKNMKSFVETLRGNNYVK